MKRLIINIDEDNEDYTIESPDGEIDTGIIGSVIADIMIRYFDPDADQSMDDDEDDIPPIDVDPKYRLN